MVWPCQTKSLLLWMVYALKQISEGAQSNVTSVGVLWREKKREMVYAIAHILQESHGLFLIDGW